MDLKATIDNAGMTQYAFAKAISRSKTQVNRWYTYGKDISPLMEKHIRSVCEAEGIKVIEK